MITNGKKRVATSLFAPAPPATCRHPRSKPSRLGLRAVPPPHDASQSVHRRRGCESTALSLVTLLIGAHHWLWHAHELPLLIRRNQGRACAQGNGRGTTGGNHQRPWIGQERKSGDTEALRQWVSGNQPANRDGTDAEQPDVSARTKTVKISKTDPISDPTYPCFSSVHLPPFR